jgi:NTP pyrophosphatase (non-canonical NTP hydrolase)
VAVDRSAIYRAIDVERGRQDAQWRGSHGWGSGDCSSDGVAAIVKVAVLSEECGEVARAILDKTDPTTELVQVAAVAVAWLELLGVAEEGPTLWAS